MIRTLIVDADNLFKIGFHGVREFYHDGQHIGGIFHFLNVVRKLLIDQEYDKVFVVWDGPNNSIQRKAIYSEYKNNRTSSLTESKRESFYFQKNRVKQYLEEMFVRQIDIDNNEADDLIAYYCQVSPDENKTIFSGDRDLTQLISERVSIYSPNTKTMYKNGDKIKIYHYEFPHQNIKTYKILSGDKSDNIDGISGLGEKTLIKFFPELLEKTISIDDILEKAKVILKENKNNKTLQNLLSGKTKSGIYGDNFFEINKKIVDLSEPMITDEAKELVELYYRESLDPDGRGYKNLMKMMMEDGLFRYLPNTDDAWINFLKPFMKLTRKEKRNFNTNKI